MKILTFFCSLNPFMLSVLSVSKSYMSVCNFLATPLDWLLSYFWHVGYWLLMLEDSLWKVKLKTKKLACYFCQCKVLQNASWSFWTWWAVLVKSVGTNCSSSPGPELQGGTWQPGYTWMAPCRDAAGIWGGQCRSAWPTVNHTDADLHVTELLRCHRDMLPSTLSPMWVNLIPMQAS